MPTFYGIEVTSRLMLGTAQYPSPAILAEAFRRSGAGIATVSVRREAGGDQAGALQTIGPSVRSSAPRACRCPRRCLSINRTLSLCAIWSPSRRRTHTPLLPGLGASDPRDAQSANPPKALYLFVIHGWAFVFVKSVQAFVVTSFTPSKAVAEI